MERELRVHIDVYVEMGENDTEEDALSKLDSVLISKSGISYQIYETEIQEC